jgi:hypothetical protein
MVSSQRWRKASLNGGTLSGGVRFRLAANGNVAAAIFLAKNLLRYKDVFSNEHSGPAAVEKIGMAMCDVADFLSQNAGQFPFVVKNGQQAAIHVD